MPEHQQASESSETLDLLGVLAAASQSGRNWKFNASELSLLEALESADIETSTCAHFFLHDLALRVKEAVVLDERFPGTSVRMVCNDGGASGFYPHFMAASLVRRAIQSDSPIKAVEWLEKVLSTNAATGKTVHALWGVPVAQATQLASDVWIVPIANLPDSKQKRWITEHSHVGAESSIVTMLNFEQPQSALVMARRIEPFIFDPDALPKLPNEAFLESHKLLLDITLALTVIGPRAPISAAQWFTFDDSDIEEAVPAGRRGRMLEILPVQSIASSILDPEEAPQIIQAYLALQGKVRQKLHLALQRLNQAQHRHTIGDRAVELSTAFETLLGDDGTTEMTHKIKTRSVRLIGGTNEVRKKNAAIMTKAYSFRSKLVHSGYVDASKSETICGQRMSSSEVIDHAIRICAELIKIVIRRGSIPDWSIFDITEQT